MYHSGRAEAKLVMKKAMGSKSLVGLSVQNNVFDFCVLHPDFFNCAFGPFFPEEMHFCLFISIEIQETA